MPTNDYFLLQSNGVSFVKFQSPVASPNRMIYCWTGCNLAVAAYFSRLRGLLGVPPSPALLADSLGPTSLQLEWRCREAEQWAGLTARLQWCYHDLGDGWRYAKEAVWDVHRKAFLVEGLRPYTKYRVSCI